MNRKYINQIIRKLKCSKKKRKEIKRQLLSEMDEELKDAMQSPGNPTEIAEEFNNSFSEEEKKVYKKEMCMKVAGLVLVLLIIVAGIIWWMIPKQIWLEDSKVFDVNDVEAQAKTVLDCFDRDDYEALKEMSDDKMREFLNNHDLESDKPLIAEDWGKREEIGKVYMVELTQRGKKSAVVQMHVQYENANVMYTISFNRDMELQGFWMQ